MRFNSIQSKITLWIGALLLVTIGIVIFVAAFIVRDNAEQTTRQQATILAQEEAARVQSEMEQGFDAARTLAQTLAAVKDPENPISLTREQVNGMLRQVLLANPNFLGTYSLWEPNAFDGRDADFVNADVAHDQTGRFIPYWVRDADGAVRVEALLEYETPGIGDWYLLPRQTKEEHILDPFFYLIQGEDVLLTSFVVPIVQDGQFYGIAGVDLRIDFLQQLADQANTAPFSGRMALISSDGTLAGVAGRQNLIGEPASALFNGFETFQVRLSAGQQVSVSRENEQQLWFFSPIYLGQTSQPWTAALIVPQSAVTEKSFALMFYLVSVGSGAGLVSLFFLWVIVGQFSGLLRQMADSARRVTQGDLEATLEVNSRDELGVLAETFNDMSRQLRATINSLEARVHTRTAGLEALGKLTEQLISILDVAELATELVKQVKQTFNFYHVRIYLLDSTENHLTLAAGTGTAGVSLLESQHNITFHSDDSLVARSARSGLPLKIDNVRHDSSWASNALLPDTYSEMAVPIVLQQQVVGVLNVQQDRVSAFDDSDVNLMRGLAGQVAVAIRNARLFEQVQTRLHELQQIQERYTQQSWQSILARRQNEMRYLYQSPAADGGAPQFLPLAELDSASTHNAERLTTPIKVRGQTIGGIQLEANDPQVWNEGNLAIIQAVADQFVQTAENLRLFTETRDRTAREQVIREITEKLRAAPNLDFLLQTAARELGERLNIPYTVVEVGRKPNQEK